MATIRKYYPVKRSKAQIAKGRRIFKKLKKIISKAQEHNAHKNKEYTYDKTNQI